MEYTKFDSKVIEHIENYVYRLVDPRSGNTFYVGRGIKNRIFDHIHEAKMNKSSDKCDVIREIHNQGLKVITIIHRHGLSPEHAAVEAALIDAYPGIVNQKAGEGSGDFGVRSSKQIISTYHAEIVDFAEKKILLISISPGWIKNERDFGTWEGIYNQTRFQWALKPARARKAEFVVAHALGLIRGVFVANDWRPATDLEFADFPGAHDPRRFGFIGNKAEDDVWTGYVNKQLPQRFRTTTGQPIQYVNIPSRVASV